MKRVQRTDRSIIRISGDDSRSFLQGLISNDITRADGTRGLYAALLTPQGKYLYDFFIVADDGALLLDCLAEDAAQLIKKLTMFKLRSKVTLEDVSDAYDVHLVFGDGASGLLTGGAQTKTPDGAILYADPRLNEAGVRVIAPKASFDAAALGAQETDDAAYQHFRIALGLPEAPLDLEKDKSILLESGFDELSGVDWKKGCYMGQELTARTKYRGLIKKRLVPVAIDGAAVPGTDILADGRVVGDLRSVSGDLGIAMLRLGAIAAGQPLDAGDATVTPQVPAWMQLPQDGEDAEA